MLLRFISLFAAVVAVALTSDVIVLHDSDFDDVVKQHDIVLVEFFAPWCGHCKRLAPEFEKAATKLKDNDPPIALASVDATVETGVAGRFGVSGYPTLKIFRNGELSQDYEGPREAEGIIKYMRGQAGPSSKELKSQADLDKFIGGDEHSVIGFFEGESKLKDSFMKVADTERDRFRFAHTTNKDLVKKHDYSDDIVIFAPKRLHNKFEPNTFKYDGNYDTDKIKKFLNEEMHGLCGHRTPDTRDQFSRRPLVVAYYNVDYVKDPKGTNYWRNRVLKVAQDYKRKVYFAISDRAQFGQEITEMGIGNAEVDKPAIAAFGVSGEKFPMTEDFSMETLKTFVDDLLADKLEPYMKSEPVPDQDGPVTVLVAKNFKEFVNDEQDALIEFYAPWCGHCKSLAPIYDELGEALKGEKVVIAKMDATANDVPPGYEVRGFPTLFWKPKGQPPQAYNGGRELQNFIDYIAKQSTDGLKGYDRSGKKKAKKEL